MNVKIPKVIHYCWFGGKPLPAMALDCIESWKKYLPNYKIKQWDETNFDVNVIPYTKQAYAEKKYAFVSDYARFWILYHFGGIYFDTDVEVIKPLDDIIAQGPFMGCQNKYNPNLTALSLAVAPGLGLGTYAGHPIYKELLELYSGLDFYKPDGMLNLKTIVHYTTEVLLLHGLVNTPDIQQVGDIWIYPWDYFCPMSPTLILDITPNSRTIHLFSASWETPRVKFRKRVKRMLGYKVVKIIQPLISIIRKGNK